MLYLWRTLVRVIGINLNGRSVCNKGLLSWLAQQETEIICMQEFKVHPNSSAALPETTTPWASNEPFKANLPCPQKINKPSHWQKRSTSRDPH